MNITTDPNNQANSDRISVAGTRWAPACDQVFPSAPPLNSGKLLRVGEHLEKGAFYSLINGVIRTP